MSTFRVYKEVGSLPGVLQPDSLYAVRTGVGFDLYITDTTGSVAHKVNSGTSIERNLIADRLISAAAISLNSNPRTKPVVPESKAPVISISSTKPAELTRTYDPGTTGEPFVFSGGTKTFSSGFASFPSTTPNSTQMGFAWRASLVLDGTKVSFNLDSAASGYRFIVDGQYVSFDATTYNTGSPGWYTLTWETRERRHIIVEGDTTLRFGQVATEPLSKVMKPLEKGIKGYFVGDSNSFVHGFPLKSNSYACVLMDSLGISAQTVNAVSSTGFVATWGANNYQARQSDWNSLSEDQDVIFIQMSINDITLDVSNVDMKAAATTLIANARLAHPNSLIIVIGIITWDEFGTSLSEHETAVAEAVSETNDDYVIFIPVRNAPEEEILTGSMYATDGTASFYVDDASGHLSYAGNAYIGKWLAERVIEAVSNALNIPVPNQVFEQKPQDAVADGGGGGGAGEATVVYNSGRFRAVSSTGNSTHSIPGTIVAGNVALISIAHYHGSLSRISAVTVGGINATLDHRYEHPDEPEFCSEIWRVPAQVNPISREVIVTYSGVGTDNWMDGGLIEVNGIGDQLDFSESSGTGASISSGGINVLESSFAISAVASVSGVDNHVYTELSSQTEIWEEPDSLNWIAGVGAYSNAPVGSFDHQWSVSPATNRWVGVVSTYSITAAASSGYTQNLFIGTTQPTPETGVSVLWINTSGGNISLNLVTGD